jgi:hydroxyacylglutathione hydrolase
MIDVVPLRAFKDHYIRTLRAGERVIVVDPGDPAPVFDSLTRERLTLTAILATHDHTDHVDSVAELTRGLNVPAFGPRGEPISTITHPVSEGDRVDLPGIGVSFAALDIPRPTRAHAAYYAANLLLCGDTLFSCGRGRLFDGTPEPMHASLAKLAALRDDTLPCCGHE